MAAATVRVGLLGAGYIADWHAQALRAVHGVQLTAVCDTSRGRAEALARRYGAPGVYASLDDLIAAGGVDAVHVLLPPDHHFAATKRLLEAGLHVLIEKPMCPGAADCNALVELAREKGRTIGVGHNFLFFPIYEQLRADIAAGLLGRIEHVSSVWNKELGQLRAGPFGSWLCRAPGNPILEVGPHAVGHLLDLLGVPERVTAEADRPTELPGGLRVPRRWLVRAHCGGAVADLLFHLGPGNTEHTLTVRGTAGLAFVDFERNAYVLRRPGGAAPDFDRHHGANAEARALRRQARGNLARYILSKMHLSRRGKPFAVSIACALASFYGHLGGEEDRRLSGPFAAQVMETCGKILHAAGQDAAAAPPIIPLPTPKTPPTTLVLGGTGFIGRALVRRLAEAGQSVRMLVRDPNSVTNDLRALPVDVARGDLTDAASVRKALEGVRLVFHLARPHVNLWEDYLRLDVEPTRQLAELCLETGVRRFVYTGTIDSYYSGNGSEVITEETPLDPRIHRRNLYARAKAMSEGILLEMHKTKGLPLVIVRPGVVLGSGGSPYHWGIGFWGGPSSVRLWGDGTNPVPLVLVEDVARGLVTTGEVPGIEGQSFNLVSDPCLTAREYLDELARVTKTKLDVRPTPAWRMYAGDMFKWVVKVLVRHPGRRLPSYRDWQTRAHRARFDCSKAKRVLAWDPARDRERMLEEGVRRPVAEWLA